MQHKGQPLLFDSNTLKRARGRIERHSSVRNGIMLEIDSVQYLFTRNEISKAEAFTNACNEQYGNHPYLSLRNQLLVPRLDRRSTDTILANYISRKTALALDNKIAETH